jgi:hypothetical protein
MNLQLSVLDRALSGFPGRIESGVVLPSAHTNGQNLEALQPVQTGVARPEVSRTPSLDRLHPITHSAFRMPDLFVDLQTAIQ